MNAELKKQKYLSLALLVLSLMSLFVLFDEIILKRLTKYQQSINQSQGQISRFEGFLSQKSLIDSKAKEVEKDLTLKDQLLPESDKRKAEANLQSKLKGLIEKNSGVVSTIQILPEVSGEDGLVKVSVKAQAIVKPQFYEALLRAIEEEKPFLFVDFLRLNIRQVAVKPSLPAAQQVAANPKEKPVQKANSPAPAESKVQIDYSMDLTVSGYIQSQME